MEVTTTKADDTSAAEAFNKPLLITLTDGKEYPVTAIGPDETAATENWLKSQRIATLMDNTRNLPLPHEVKARALAEVCCKSIQLADILDSENGRLHLLTQSLNNGSTNGHTFTVAEVRKLAPKDVNLMGEVMYFITKLTKPETDDVSADPTTPTKPRS
jgi:hypothetical protein